MYRTMSAFLFILLIIALIFLTDGMVTAALLALVIMIVIVLTQAALLRCQHCGARPGLWILTIWTLLFDPVLYLADALFLRDCPNCKKCLSAKVSNTENRCNH